MSAFEYAALDGSGRLRKGVLEGDTPRQIRQALREKNLVPVSVTPVAEKPGRRLLLPARSMPAADLALITRQLATLVRAGTVLEEAILAVAEQSEKTRSKSILLALRARILEGHSLATACGEFPATFSDLYRSTVEAGEQAGALDLVLERLADYTEFRQQLRQKIMLALLYPSLLTTVALLVVGGLVTYVVPQVVSVFQNIGQELPLLTRALIRTSDFLRHYNLALLLMAGLATAGVKIALGHEQRLRQLHGLLLKLPLIGRFVRALNTARFTRAFSILTASGVPALEGLQIAGEVLGNLVMRQAVVQAALRVREGGSISQALTRAGCFPPLTLHLIASGEASSNLEEMLDRAATSHEREVETLITTAMTIFEPVLILVMGGIVLLIVLAILLPIFNLNQLVH